ncbi:MAG: hypothetical protein TH68_02330, partial [Candidatus Synechococcus spongiarum 142]
QTTLSFSTSNWQTEQTVTVSAADDDNAGPEEVRLSHSASGGNYDSLRQDLVVTVTDDDTASLGLVLSPLPLTMVEGESATYTIKLATPPTEAVTVTVSGMGSGMSVDTDGALAGAQTSLGFRSRWLTSPSNWNVEQTVTVSVAADDNTIPDTVTLSHSAAGGEYDAVSRELVVTVLDTAVPGLVLSSATAPLALEEGGSATYTVRLSQAPTDGVVTVTVLGGMSSGVSLDTDAGTEGDQA